MDHAGDYTFGRVMAAGAIERRRRRRGARISRGTASPTRRHSTKIRHRRDYYAKLVPGARPSTGACATAMCCESAGTTGACITGYGHAPEHMALHCEALGVLIRATWCCRASRPTYACSTSSPKATRCALPRSLGPYEALPAETLVLPSHGRPFSGLHTRIDQLRAAPRRAPRRGAGGVRAAADERGRHRPLMFKRALDLHQMTFAMGEAIAHLHLLWLAGELERQQDADGVVRFVPVIAAKKA